MADASAAPELHPGGSIAVELLWLPGDWPDSDSPALGRDNASDASAYALPAAAGRGDRDPVLASRQFLVAPDSLLADVLDTALSPAGKAALASGRIGVAVHGRRQRPGLRLRAGDRIELLARIVADPQSERRARVKAERQQQGAERGRDKWRTR